jgi:hypothetical protein
MKALFLILLVFTYPLFAGNDSFDENLYTSSSLIKTGVVTDNSYDKYTIEILEDGDFEVSLAGSDEVYFQYNSLFMPWAGDGTYKTYGPVSLNAGDTIYISVDAPNTNAEQSYSITFTLHGENSPPSDITLSSSSINENSTIGTIVGTLATTDVDEDDTFTYAFAGGEDDASFSISDNNLITNSTFDYNTQNLYTILIQTSDAQGETFSKEFNISITEGNAPQIEASQTFNIDESANAGDDVGTIQVTNSPTSFSITYDSSDNNFSIDNLGVITLANPSNLDYESVNSYTLGIFASNADGSDEKNITIHVTNIIAPPDSNTYNCDMFGSVIVTYDHLDVSGTANAQACGTEEISYPSGQISGTIDCLSDIACGGTGASCERVDPPANQLTYDWTHPDDPIEDESPSNPVVLNKVSYGNISYSGTNASFEATATNPYNNNKYMYIGDATFDQSLISFTSGDYYFESFSITKNKNDIHNFYIDATNGPVRIFIKNTLSLELNNLYLNHLGNPSDLLIYVGGDFTNPGDGGGNTHMNAYFYVEGDVTLNNNSNNWIIQGGITAEGIITIAGNNPDFIQSDTSADLGYGECTMCYANMIHSGISMGPFSMFYDLQVPIISSINTTDTSVTEIHKSFFTFSFMSTNDVIDESGSTIYEATEINSGYTQGAMGMDMSLFSDKAITYPLGDYQASDRYSLHSSGIFDFDFGDWNDSLAYIANYTDSSGRVYQTQLSPCQYSNALNSFSPAILDAVDTTCSTLIGCQDHNISTKISGKNYDLNILDINSSSGMIFGVSLIDASNSKIYYIGEVNATDTGGITTLTQEGIIDNLPLDISSKEAWIQFYFCNGEADWKRCWNVSGNNLYGRLDANESSSNDKFSIRPESFKFDINASDVLKLKSGTNYTLDVNATLYSKEENVSGYTQTLSDLNEKNASLVLTPSNVSCTKEDTQNLSATFENGNYNYVNFTYNDVGDIKITFLDKEWTSIDQSNGGCISDSNSTTSIPFGCDIENTKNIRFIPEHFNITATFNNSNQDSNFTYISDDLNHAATLELNITAVSEDNSTTTNYTSECYAKDFNLSIGYDTLNITPASSLQSIKYEISSIDKNGSIPINSILSINDINNTLFTASNAGKANVAIKINFDRTKNNVVNPFRFNINEINSTDEDDINGTLTEEQNTTFVYGRTNTPRQSFEGNSGTSYTYFEVYCFESGCDKTILQNTTSPLLKSTNDIRWYINENHNATDNGIIGIITQKYGNGVSSTAPSATNPTISTLSYTKASSYGYPFKTTMENNASNWLIYNKDTALTNKNNFQIEFIKVGEWIGESETQSTTTKPQSAKINRRTIW